MKKLLHLSILFLLVGTIVFSHATKSAESFHGTDKFRHERKLSLKTNKYGDRSLVSIQISSTGSVEILNH